MERPGSLVERPGSLVERPGSLVERPGNGMVGSLSVCSAGSLMERPGNGMVGSLSVCSAGSLMERPGNGMVGSLSVCSAGFNSPEIAISCLQSYSALVRGTSHQEPLQPAYLYSPSHSTPLPTILSPWIVNTREVTEPFSAAYLVLLPTRVAYFFKTFSSCCCVLASCCGCLYFVM